VALPATEVELAQAGVDDDGETELAGQDLRRLARAAQVARVDRVDPCAGKRAREHTCLFAAELVERRVRLALDPAVAVPVRLAVAHEQDRRRRHGDTVATWISGSATASAS
jgi:hypothetical protein